MCERVFVSGHDPNLKGNVAEAVIAAEAIKLGLAVSKPLTEHCRYDLIFDLGYRLLRVQCKWAPRRKEVVAVNLAGYRWTPNGQVRSTYTTEEVDAIGVYCEAIDRCYLVPIDLVAGRRAVWLRLTQPKNRQRAGLSWAVDYELRGAVAQLEVASAWQAEGRGFESHQLHSLDERADAVAVGANEFRNRFGWYMQRAAAGESFNVTRRGKPYVRLTPGVEPLPVASPETPPDLTVIRSDEGVA